MVNINSELLNKLDSQSLELLGNIDRLHVCKYADDAKSAVPSVRAHGYFLYPMLITILTGMVFVTSSLSKKAEQ